MKRPDFSTAAAKIVISPSLARYWRKFWADAGAVNAPHAMTVTIAKAILVADNFERWVIFSPFAVCLSMMLFLY